ncbi:RecB family exonuclease [Micropruina sonneratiae]|uniref:RecB family exonuclease n=1 Tax=Micropruina sonneratiae TaxID=2986940 RepID=UPI002227BB62|nr:PD-(D/E)XK nuclease family protein [Micropruina sp. KQZ13P-5]
MLADPPEHWSYSTLKDIAVCPLRYCLEHANYPDLWSGYGYPSLPSLASLFGNVVHGALEAILKALANAGVASPRTAEASEVLVTLGGLRAVVEDETARQLVPLETNPRLSADRKRRLQRQLRERTHDARAQVQTYLSRTRFVRGAPRAAVAPTGQRHTSKGDRRALAAGSHAEVRLVADSLRLHGRVDLLTIEDARVEIVDFKTGAESPSHADQLHLYALLWNADDKSNPGHLRATTLTAAYRDHEVSVDVPGRSEFAGLAAKLKAEINHASQEAGSDSPSANPSADTCNGCSVRHLCPAYWESVAPAKSSSPDDDWFDLEAVIGEKNGQRSWWLLDGDGRQQMLLRAATMEPGFKVGDRVRLLGLRPESDPEVPSPIGSMVVTTEVFVLESST